MESKTNISLFFFFSLISLFLSFSFQQASGHRQHAYLFNFRPSKLFVFGDSYADTGNIGRSAAKSWKHPYGLTFPGKPAGRFSDGRVLTDFLARFVGIKSPIPYKFRRVGGKHLNYGMNFAYGGSGVFETLVPFPNMTTQIGFFETLIKERVFNPVELNRSSVAVVVLSGNDYTAYLARNGTVQGFPEFIGKVVNQLDINLKRVQSLGLKKIIVTALQPIGCLPVNTMASSFKNCDGIKNSLVEFHNLLLRQATAKLSNRTTSDPQFVIIDLYRAFMTVLTNKENRPGSAKFENPLKPCCEGSCGEVDEGGAKNYTVCEDRESAFFWDTVHPTQAGWRAVYSVLQQDLEHL